MDLLIASTAEISNRVALHLDKDFNLIAAITGQPLERLSDLAVRTSAPPSSHHHEWARTYSGGEG